MNKCPETKDVLKLDREINCRAANKPGAYCLENEMSNMTRRRRKRRGKRVGVDREKSTRIRR
jgi:hypothetical protein